MYNGAAINDAAATSNNTKSRLSIHLEALQHIISDHKILVAFAVIIVIFLMFNHPKHAILFLISVAISVEVGLLMNNFYKTRSYKSLELELSRREEIILAGVVAGCSGFMVNAFAQSLIEYTEMFIIKFANVIYDNDNAK